ncbi:interferon-induced very large GTPase 1 [Hoplias malabaricus]|uniref:interferon-induced very large GTPase 1 n=1 Tax=Hoplias malabaricus TaxID=27720 RepID=UPI003462CE44
MSLHRQKLPERRTHPTEIVSETDRDKHILLQMLDLHRQRVVPTDLTSMLYTTSSCLQDTFPQNPAELPNAFLRRLWLHHPQTRSPSCEVVGEYYAVARPPEMSEDSQCAINPLDLVAAVYMTTNSFLQQEITYRMVQCNFAVPLYLPPVYPEKTGTFLLCPFRGVLGRWNPDSSEDSRDCIMKNMASSRMPLLSAVRLSQCSVSKSRVLNSVLGTPQKSIESFVHRDMDGGQLPRILSDGLVEVYWNLTQADQNDSVFSQPVLIGNLRGDAADYEKQVSLLCYASAVLVVFCGNFGDKERTLLSSWRDNAGYLILIDCSLARDEDSERTKQRLMKDLELPEESLINGHDCNEDTLAEKLRDALNLLIPKVHTTNLVAAAGMASDLNLKIDEDEICRMAFTEAEEVLHGIENGVSKFLEEQLPLQGPTWKRLCHLEKEEGRSQGQLMPQQGQEPTEAKEELVEKFMNYNLTTAMKTFIEAVCTYDVTKRAYFLSWIRVKLQVMQLDKLSVTEQEQQQNPCIGLEHFLREMGLIYERYFRGPNYELYEMFRLPYLAAELLLYGVPLELFDGDAAVFPLNWVYSVLYEVYRQLPQYSRMRVLTTLGFHNSRNAEILSALFGVNFPKWGQRHIKGAYMLLLSLPDNIRMELDCEFLLLICTEGLNSPHAGQEEGNFVHDNELATFVSGLSDVTLVNFPHDNQAISRKNLQIAVNALLRSKDTERKPNFHVVSEGSTNNAKIMSCVIDVLAQENSSANAETELHHTEGRHANHDLTGPWSDHSLSSGNSQIYSDAALELKQRLLAIFHEKATTCQPTCLGAFMENMCKLWESVKNQNFSVGFGDTHVADALVSLCTKLSEGEEQLVDLMDHWAQGLENQISGLKESTSFNGDHGDTSETILGKLGERAAMQISTECEKIKSSLWDQLRQEDNDIALMDTYQTHLLKKVELIQQQVTLDINPKIESAIVRHDLSVKMQALLTALEAALEVKLRSLLERSKSSDTLIDEKQLKEEFAEVWDDIPSNYVAIPLDSHEVHTRVVEKLKENLNSRGLKKQKIKLKDGNSLRGFTVKNGHFALQSKMKRTLKYNKEVVQRFTNNLIQDYERRVSEKQKHKEGYSDSYMGEILAIVDKGLEVLKCEPFKMKPKYEMDVKTYICSKALESFQQMHNVLRRERETKEAFLNEMKEQHLQDFLHSFHKRDECQKAAQAFTALCLKPTALDFIYSSLERQILNDMLAKDHEHIYSSPKKFHYHLLKELLLEDSFEKVTEYLQSSESFYHKRIEHNVVEHLSGSVMMEDRREQRMKEICQRLKRSLVLSFEESNGVQSNARLLLERMCVILQNTGDVTVHSDSLGAPLFDITPQRELFLTHLKESVAELSLSLAQDFSVNTDAIEVPEGLSCKLQKLLYDRVKGCDQQCPFCKAPCDLGGTQHAVHEALVHRPKGLVCYTIADSTTLSHIHCSAEMAGENLFQYIYPDWNIPANSNDTDIYWKFMLTRYNTRFAQEYNCEPASLPEDWKKITKDDALKNLKKAFYISE